MKKIIDNNGKVFGKISIIDLCVLALAVLVLLGIGLRQSRIGQDASIIRDVPITYTVEVANVRHWTRDNIRAGDQVFTANTQVGVISGVTYRPYVGTVATEQGVLQGVVEGRYIVSVEIEARGTIDNGRVLVSHSVPMGSGNAHIQITTRYASFTGNLVEIHYEQ